MNIKKFSIVLGAVVIALLLLFQIYLKPRLPILTGYAAKMACSCSFIANRSIESITQEDLDFFPMNLASASLDYNEQSAEATFFGLSPQKAQYEEGLGCALVHSKVEIPKAPYKKQYPQDSLSFAFHQKDTIIDHGFDLNQLKQTISQAFDKPGEEPSLKTRAVVVIHKGQLVAEQYGEGFDKSTPLLGWSMTKSILNALIGIQVHQGWLNINEAAPIDEWANDERKNITVDQLLNMESGLEWEENYFDMSDVTRMLYKSSNAPQTAIDKPLEFAPEEQWEYSSGTSNILSRIVRLNCTSYDEYLNFPYKELFYKIGMTSAQMETDASGYYIGSSYCFATARDWAKFGLLYLNDGVWNGERILPEGWVDYTRTPVLKSNGIYGAHFWLNVDNKAYPDAPADLFSANGFQGQRVFIIPSKDLVIVRLGLADSRSFDFNHFLKGIVELVD